MARSIENLLTHHAVTTQWYRVKEKENIQTMQEDFRLDVDLSRGSSSPSRCFEPARVKPRRRPWLNSVELYI